MDHGRKRAIDVVSKGYGDEGRERGGGVRVRWRMRIRGVRESEKSTVEE